MVPQLAAVSRLLVIFIFSQLRVCISYMPVTMGLHVWMLMSSFVMLGATLVLWFASRTTPMRLFISPTRSTSTEGVSSSSSTFGNKQANFVTRHGSKVHATQLFKATKNASQCTNPSSQLTRNEAYLQQHIIKHEKVTTDQTNFNRQLLIDKNKKSYVCGICEITFNKKANVDSHFVSHHSDNKALMAEVTSKIHKCQHCSYKCISHSNFKRHNMVIHKEIAGNVKTFKCEYCQYCTHRKYLLVRHTLIHGKVKPQVCSACCKSFIHKGDLDSHIVNNHSDNIQLMGTITYKIHECQQCSYKCVYSQSLKRHMVKHKDTKTNLQKFECEHCEYSTYIKNSLKRHLLIHSSNKPHICVICSKSFTSKHQIDSHILHKHFDNTELKTTITQKIHECPKCSYKCIIKNQLNHHLLKHNKAQI